MIIPNTITILWNGTNATIPAGFTRNTDFDGKYLYGVDTGVDPDGTGGNSTHTHTSPAHNHTQDSHTHSVSGGASSEATATRIGTKKYSTATHTQNAKDSSTATPTNQTATVTVNTASNELTRRDIIFIKSNGTNAVPNDASVFYDDTPPTNWNRSRCLEYLDWAEEVILNCPKVNTALENHFTAAITKGREIISK